MIKWIDSLLHLMSKQNTTWIYISSISPNINLRQEFCHWYISIEMIKSNTIIFSYCNPWPDTSHCSCMADDHVSLIFRAILRCYIVEFTRLWVLLLSILMLKYRSCQFNVLLIISSDSLRQWVVAIMYLFCFTLCQNQMVREN